MHTINGVEMYTHQPSDDVSPYVRYVEFAPAILEGSGMSADHVLKMTVSVQYVR